MDGANTATIIALLGLGLSVVVNLIGIGNLKGVILTRLDYIEKKQDKHNGLIERMTVVEQSTKSAHHRMDRIEEIIEQIHEIIRKGKDD